MQMLMPAREKRDLLAWWLLPSFERTQFTDMDMTLYLGVHKPRGTGTKNMDEIRKDPDAFLPKMDISVFTYYNTGESFPVYARETASLIAGINILHALDKNGGPSMTDLSMVLLKNWIAGRNDISSAPYEEFDPNKVSYDKIAGIANKIGPSTIKYELIDPVKRVKDMMWLKGAGIKMKRPLRDKKNAFLDDVLFIGKDIKRNEIMLAMKKSYGNYTRLVPLNKKGLNFITSIRFMIEMKPSKYPIIAGSTMERMIQEKTERMKGSDLVFCDITAKTGAIIDCLGLG